MTRASSNDRSSRASSRSHVVQTSFAETSTELASGLIMRERRPVNLEWPFPLLNDSIVPVHQFFVRNHFATPQIKRDAWRLRCGGHTERDVVIDYAALMRFPRTTHTATLECAGNGRVFLTPKAEGVQWELGGVGTAEWTGVRLSDVLASAGLRSGAVEVILRSADKGVLTEPPKTPGEIHFARSLPIAKALQPEVLLAFQMNGEELTPEHGFPVRAIVPGWYGMASVKWLDSITVTDQPFHGYWQTAEYSHWQRSGGEPVSVPLSRMEVKSQIAQPARSQLIASSVPHRVFWRLPSLSVARDISTYLPGTFGGCQ